MEDIEEKAKVMTIYIANIFVNKASPRQLEKAKEYIEKNLTKHSHLPKEEKKKTEITKEDAEETLKHINIPHFS